jgi:hypothetical protein
MTARIPVWLRVVVVLLFVWTAGLALLSTQLAAQAWRDSLYARGWSRPQLESAASFTALLVVLALAAALLPARPASRWPRALVYLTATQGVLLGLDLVHFQMTYEDTFGLPPLPALAIAAPIATGLLLAGALSLWQQPRHPARLLQAFTTFTLLATLFIGLWLPIAARRAEPDKAPILLAASLLAGLGAALLATRRRPLPRALRRALGAGTLLLAGVSTWMCPDRRHPGWDVYGQLADLLLLACVLSLVSIIVASATLYLRLARTRARLAGGPPGVQLGIVEAEGRDAVGWLRYTGFLRGLDGECEAFQLRTHEGVLAVPAGSALAVALPDRLWGFSPGERLPVLHAGDAVCVEGWELPAGSAYRGSARPRPGRRGLLVAHQADRGSPLHDVVLTAWRPSLAYLLVMAIALTPPLLVALPDLLARLGR